MVVVVVVVVVVVFQLLSGAMMDGQLQKEEKDALLDYRLKNLIGEEEHWQVGGWVDDTPCSPSSYLS